MTFGPKLAMLTARESGRQKRRTRLFESRIGLSQILIPDSIACRIHSYATQCSIRVGRMIVNIESFGSGRRLIAPSASGAQAPSCTSVTESRALPTLPLHAIRPRLMLLAASRPEALMRHCIFAYPPFAYFGPLSACVICVLNEVGLLLPR